MPFETSAHRLWKTLGREERLEAARAFWERPSETAAIAAAREIVGILKVRPQAFGKVPLEQRVRAVAGLASPPEVLAEALILALHMEKRRELLGAFLDALGIAHEEGLIAEDAVFDPPTPERARAALAALSGRFGEAAIRVYWNALWLQDRERWGALEGALEAPAASA
jgi:hypothetical protein